MASTHASGSWLFRVVSVPLLFFFFVLVLVLWLCKLLAGGVSLRCGANIRIKCQGSMAGTPML